MLEIILEKIRKLTNKKNVYLTKRCNESLKIAVRILKKKGVNTLLIQEEGGWLTYSKLAKQNELELKYVKMIKGKLNAEELNNYSGTLLLIHTMPGYSYKESVEKIAKICLEKNIYFINDCCGSIGTIDATYGDIVVCSFGKAKPLSCGGGGFIASNLDLSKELDLTDNFYVGDAKEIIDLKSLNEALDNLDEKMRSWKAKSMNIKKELKDLGYDILNEGEQGINILVPYSANEEKERLIKYLDNMKLEFTECPRYIRTNKQALSIEIKRLG